ncbi:MAG: amidohydrolase, partial [Phenylobacterium sp.]|nr:amidohydrolase [Phenylobacterium sp.]
MKSKIMTATALVLSALVAPAAFAAELPEAQQAAILQTVDQDAAQISETALAIWGFAEVGYQETQSSALLQKELTEAGFSVTTG